MAREEAIALLIPEYVKEFACTIEEAEYAITTTLRGELQILDALLHQIWLDILSALGITAASDG